MDYKQITELIGILSKSNVSKIKVEDETQLIEIEMNSAQGGQCVIKTDTDYVQNEKIQNDEAINIIKSPMVGNFYTASSEGEKPFINIGDKVEKGQIIGIVEAMKLMNEIESPFAGTVEEICVENGELVEYNQPLVRIV